jgi:hypothetical protein
LNAVERTEDGFTVDAAVIAEAFELDAAEVPGLLRSGRIATVCEAGAAEDAGKHRLTFTSTRGRLQLVVDQSGAIVRRSVTKARPRPRGRRS